MPARDHRRTARERGREAFALKRAATRSRRGRGCGSRDARSDIAADDAQAARTKRRGRAPEHFPRKRSTKLVFARRQEAGDAHAAFARTLRPSGGLLGVGRRLIVPWQRRARAVAGAIRALAFEVFDAAFHLREADPRPFRHGALPLQLIMKAFRRDNYRLLLEHVVVHLLHAGIGVFERREARTVLAPRAQG